MTRDRLGHTYDRKYEHEAWQAYRPYRLKPEAWSTTRYDDIARLLADVGPHSSCLDVGCGNGALLFALANRFERLTGIDVTLVRIEAARRILKEHESQHARKMEFLVADVTEPLPFSDREFDVVVACAVLEHCLNVFAAMDEIARVTKPGGHCLITVPNICYIKYVFGLLIGRVPLTGAPARRIEDWRRTGWDGEHLHYFSKSILLELLRDVGFVPEKVTGDGKWAKLRRWGTNLVGSLTVRARRAASGPARTG